MLEDRLLPGENPLSCYAEDCQLWVEVYTELITVTGHLERNLREQSAPPNVMKDLLLQEQLARFNRRLDYWRGRFDEVASQASVTR